MSDSVPPTCSPGVKTDPTLDEGSILPTVPGGTSLPPNCYPLDVALAVGATPAIPGYAIEKELGRGGMGVVYKARQLSLNRVVALKMIRSAEMASAEEVRRFLIEAESVAALAHPNIVQVYECGRFGAMPFMVMEYVEGGALSQRIAAKPLPPREAAEIVVQVAKAVQYAHERQIVHRDLKPDNVLMMADGTAKVTDFGLAKRIDLTSQTQTGAVLGTPSYMSPEQAHGVKEVGPPADVYALGAILYHLLTGRPPFNGPSTFDVLQKVIKEDVVSPRKVNPVIAKDLETICLKCLDKNPARRYARAGDLAGDLSRFLAGEQIHARPAGPFRRAGRWVGRHWKAGALVVALLGVAALYLAYRAMQGPSSLALRHACPAVPWEPEEVETIDGKPLPVDLSGFEIIERSGLMDFRAWEPVPPQLRTERIEPAYGTVVFRLRKRPGSSNNRWLSQQYRTSGLAAYPRCVSHPYQVRQYRYAETMPDDRIGKVKRTMTTWEVRVDLADAGNAGEEFEVIIHTLWWNAFQDQERGRATEWFANRFDYPLEKANNTLLMPRGKRLSRWGFSDFPAGTNQPFPSDQTPGTRVNPERGFIYWDVTDPRQDHVYRVDWAWEDR
jgi:tRNA A-37 threonylcarbamoyl transferase component Bud32